MLGSPLSPNFGVIPGPARLKKFSDQAAPSGLVRSAHPAPGIAVKILVEQDVIAEVWITRELRVIVKHRTFALFILQKNSREPARQFVRDFFDGDEVSRSVRTFDLEVITVVVMELLQRFDQ